MCYLLSQKMKSMELLIKFCKLENIYTSEKINYQIEFYVLIMI